MKQYTLTRTYSLSLSKILPKDEVLPSKRAVNGCLPELSAVVLKRKIFDIESSWIYGSNPHLDKTLPTHKEREAALIEKYTAFYRRKLERIYKQYPELAI